MCRSMPSLCSGMSPGVAGYGVMLAAGGMIAIAVEWVAMHLIGRWTYTAYMPMFRCSTSALSPPPNAHFAARHLLYRHRMGLTF
jgi:hypothetical protein